MSYTKTTSVNTNEVCYASFLSGESWLDAIEHDYLIAKGTMLEYSVYGKDAPYSVVQAYKEAEAKREDARRKYGEDF